MAFDIRKRSRIIPSAWIVSSVLLALSAGYCIAMRNLLWLPFLICSGVCAFMITRNLNRIIRQMRYIIEATLDGDFSYKFPIVNVGNEERSSNMTLNRIVEHLEEVSLEARKNDAFLTQIFNMADIGLALADAKGNITICNEPALRLLDRQALTHVCQIPCEADVELIIKRREVTVNDKIFTLFTFTDLRHQMQLVEVESWEKLIRVLTHEIMNSLTPIQSIAETVSGKASSKEIIEALDTISSSSGSLMHFVKNFREFSLLPEPRMRVLYLKPLLESVIRIAESYDNANKIDFNLVCFPPELMVYSDESLLNRVLINIIKNAVEANPDSISVEAEVKADDSVEIRISNDGELISEETAEHIFTPFFTTRQSGNGIGLSLSRRIITHLGGTLSFKTRPITSFSINL